MPSSTLSPYVLAQINSLSYADDAHYVPRNYGSTSLSVRSFEATDDTVLSRFASAAISRSRNQQNRPAIVNTLLHDEKPIPFTSKPLNKFYEPVILLVALMDAVSPNSSSLAMISNPASTSQQTDFQVFKAFVNKLSHICSSAKGRETVTSFVILQDDKATESAKNSRVHYWFAMNEQSLEQLADTKTYVESLLCKIGRAPAIRDSPEGWEATKRDIFRDVLVFNRPRITTYLRTIRERVDNCLKRLKTENTDESRLLAASIEEVVEPDSFGETLGGPEAEYLDKIQSTIRRILMLERCSSYPALLRRAEQGRLMSGSSQECFSDLVHTAKRILAYPQSVQYILTKAYPKWPGLFKNNPLVSFLPSSKAIPTPGRMKSFKAENIVGRMTRKEKEIRIFRDFVQYLQAFDLDERIKHEYEKDTFTPIVHSEVLLLNWLWLNFGATGLDGKKAIDPSVFFNGWMYIGSSKPTCRLCHYYFEERRSGVEHRDTHMNLYPPWAFPEVFPSQGEEAILDRQIMLDRVLQRVRKDAFEVVRKKVSPHHKAEDSNTFSEVVTLDDRWTIMSRNSDVDVDEITSMMGEMHTEDRYDDDGDDDDDNDNGGARL
ncbi:hypothetical protein V8F20_004250 [Naviculisporaceae sp. PSN 640]